MKNKKAKTLCKKSISLLLTLLLVLTAVPLGGLTVFAVNSEVKTVFYYQGFECELISDPYISDSYDEPICKITGYTGSESVLSIPAVISSRSIGKRRIRVIALGENTFRNNTTLTNVTIPYTVTSIGENAFTGCTALESIKIPDSVEDIQKGAFKNCTALKSISLPNQLYSLSNQTFQGCSSLEEVFIPPSNSDSYVPFWFSIGIEGFQGCTALKNLIGFDRVEMIGENAFGDCVALDNIIVSEEIRKIGANAFKNTSYYNNPNHWENGVLYLEKYLLEAMPTIHGEYHIKSGTTLIADAAFKDCDTLESVVFPDSVTTIGRESFFNCSLMKNVTVSENVTEIGNYAFGFVCDEEQWPYTHRRIEDFTIKGRSNTAAEDYALNYSIAFTGDPTKFTYTVLENGTIEITGTEQDCPPWRITEIPTVYDGYTVTKIGDGAFAGCDSLIRITIPNSVTSIGDVAFMNTNLWDIIIPDGVTDIGIGAFNGCVGLSRIIIPDSVTNIGYEAFTGTYYAGVR